MQEIFRQQLLKSACALQWKKVGLFPHHGIVIMLSALHSKKSCGGGEFLDLLPLLKWAPRVGLNFIQLLPLNDTGFDNSPYNPLSTLALNPVYLSLYALDHLNADLKKMVLKYQSQKLTQKYNYQKMRLQKFAFLRTYFDTCFSKIKTSSAFKKFLEENAWVNDYGLYCALSDFYHSDQPEKWPRNIQKISLTQKNEQLKKHSLEISFYQMIQFLCFTQLKHVRSIAEKNNVRLMGDLPFLVSKTSCDAWSYPELFCMDQSVGSPPDDLTPKGQNWNFPAYNWEKHHQSDYSWWKTRLQVAENFFHLYRLDHIIGFFRTWNIPKGQPGSKGAFSPSDPNTWLDHGKQFLQVLIKSSKMLPIGEDLVIPQTVKDTLRELGICGTNILTWQRTGAGGLDFVPYPLYVAATITHIASHDTVTLSQWWKTYPKVAKQFSLWKNWKYTPRLTPKMRFEILHDSHHTSSLFHANLLQEYLALFPEMSYKNDRLERINYPGTPSKNNWCNRFIPSVETITSSRKLFDAFKKITT